MNEPLTPKQRKVLDFVRDHVERNRFAPTAREIAEAFGIAEKNGFYYLDLLERKGYLRRRPHRPRAIEFPGAPFRPAVAVPILGRVPAGSPREALEASEGELLFDPSLAGEGDVFALRVTGDSMTGAHISEGDYVLVRHGAPVSDGDVVVAVVAGEATVKRFRLRGGRAFLDPENPAYLPIPVPEGEDAFRIAGKVTGVYRKL
jgi:repressor LexA